MAKLSARRVAAITKPGLYGDGNGLWLQVGPTGGKSWAFRYQLHRRARQMGLGPVDLVPLAEARQKAHAARRMLFEGIDPLGHRREQCQPAPARITFGGCAERYIATHEAAWRNAKHRAQWSSTLETYAYPVLGDLTIDAINTSLVLRVLEPIWSVKPETAGRLRGRIESVLSWATVAGYRAGDNPARWRGHLDQLLPARRKVRRVQHHAAMPYCDVPGFMADLRRQPGIAARALEMTILCATRTGETLGATWRELDRDLWTIPGERMKSGRQHRVPLSPAAIALVEALPRDREHLFPGQRPGRPLSNMAMVMLMRRMGRASVTVHGFRSAFRDWAAEVAHAPREVAETVLAHAIGNEVEAAYQRGDMLERRRSLMEKWNLFLLPVA